MPRSDMDPGTNELMVLFKNTVSSSSSSDMILNNKKTAIIFSIQKRKKSLQDGHGKKQESRENLMEKVTSQMGHIDIWRCDSRTFLVKGTA